MSLDIRERSLGKNSLSDNSREGKHSQTSILDFTKLHFILFLLTLSSKESKRIKSKITRFTSRLLIKHLNQSHSRNDLGNSDPEEKLAEGSLLHKGVMGSYGGEALVCLGEGVDFGTEVGGDESGPGEHADAAVLEFGLAEEVHGGEIGETEGVESDISYVSLEVGGVGHEGESLGLLSSDRSGSASCDEERGDG